MKLGDVTSQVTVGIASAATHAYQSTGIILLRNLNIKEGYLDTSDLLFIGEEYEHSFRNKRLRVGDILTVRTGYPGISAVVTQEFENAQSFTTLISRPIPSIVDSDYLCYLINSEIGKDFVNNGQAGGGQKNINAGTLTQFTFPLPTKSEQGRVVYFLKQWEKYENGLANLIEAKRTYKRGLMQQLLTGQRRFPEFQGQPWPLASIGEMITESRESLPVSNPHERITVRLNLNGVEARDVRGTEAEDATVYYLRRAGQFIYGKQNLHKGAMGIIPAELDGYSSTQDMPTFDFSATVNPQWFLYLMSREDFYLNLEKIATGTGSKRIQPASLYKIKVPFPSLPEQQRIAAVLTACDQEIELLQAQLHQWQQQKKGLMQQLLTGRLRVG
ncbi:restriction endonuclease subunit S [Hymenobacter sp. BT507]|uniref:Restriction endonuclease subunit S n=2 Tax=Hymenobacter citatus TaxID=2763506 RepID=A0ABR7MMV4_9BACT|nr:restriction endonuclease subunit S [Hymenobacter citatus]